MPHASKAGHYLVVVTLQHLQPHIFGTKLQPDLRRQDIPKSTGNATFGTLRFEEDAFVFSNEIHALSCARLRECLYMPRQ